MPLRSSAVQAALTASMTAAVFVLSWFLRFNDPSGSFAGLTDDHFFYVVRGWQILFGDLPVRDFVDHGAPLFYYLSAAVQVVFGRGTLWELAFCVTMLALGAALTFWLAARASGSRILGLAGAAVHVLLEPRFYNYPKILVYAVAIPALWRFADRPGPRSLALVAVVTAIGFLFRHDHGVFIAIAMAALLAMMTDLPRRERLRHAWMYVALVVMLVSPYLVFIQVNGGLTRYVRDASSWAARDRERAPVEWPGLADNPDGVSEAARAGSLPARAVALVRDNAEAWTYYLEIALPFFALALLSASRDAFRPDWQRAVPKIGAVAVLGIVLNAGFLRSPLAARLADPSVPTAILFAWILAAVARILTARTSLRPGLQASPLVFRIAAAATAVLIVFVLGSVLTRGLGRRLEQAALLSGPGKVVARTDDVTRRLRTEWRFSTYAVRDTRPDLVTLSEYLNTCTRVSDRVLVQQYMPQVLALARRGFAGGHADLRPGFFTSADAQQLTVARLQRQSVPVVLLEAGDGHAGFRSSFPLVTAYLDEHYRPAGTRTFDRRFGVTLLVRRDRTPVSRFEPLDWPCF